MTKTESHSVPEVNMFESICELLFFLLFFILFNREILHNRRLQNQYINGMSYLLHMVSDFYVQLEYISLGKVALWKDIV